MLPKFLITHDYEMSWVMRSDVKTYCNVSLNNLYNRNDQDRFRIDTIGITNPVDHKTLYKDLSKLVVVFWNPYSYWENGSNDIVLMHADNSNMTTHAKLVEWIEHFVMSRKGIQAIFQRIINFDYYKLLERKNLLKPEIINLAYDPENLDDDSM